jgi:hypothetical protein
VICKGWSPGVYAHAAIASHDRNPGILGRRFGGAAHHDEAFGAAWITAVALKDIATEAGGARSVPALLVFSGFGMATGSWIAGLLYDHFGYYATGIGTNILNLLLVGVLVVRQRFPTARAAYG